jgi:hypothetical protein
MIEKSSNKHNLNLLEGTKYLDSKVVNSNNEESSDLLELEEAEQKANYQTNVAKGTKNPLAYRAMMALKLANPFKGY